MIKDYCNGYFVWASETIHENQIEEEAFLIGYYDNLFGAFNKIIEEQRRDEKINCSHLSYSICESPF